MPQLSPLLRLFFWVLFILIILFIVYKLAGLAFGPSIKTRAPFDQQLSITTVEAYIKDREEALGIEPQYAKEIIWHKNQQQKSKIAIVYIHGFLADKHEIDPIPQMLAEQLSANIFRTRLKGHWQDKEIFAKTTFADWVYDTQEAFAIGKTIGEKVLFMSTSTGGTLVTYLLTQDNVQKDVIGSVFVSPNYKLKDPKASFVLQMPFGKNIALVINGETTGSDEGIDEKLYPHWIWKYPTKALMPMAASVKAVSQSKKKLKNIKVPALFLYSSKDDTVSYKKILQMAKRWGGPVQTYEVQIQEGMSPHVITGDLRSPPSVKEVSEVVNTTVKSWL